MAPFFVFGLPRSRTFWLKNFLSYAGWTVHHDLPLSVNNLDEMRAVLSRPQTGSSETALSRAEPMLRSWFPDARTVVVRRPVEEVRASMIRLGWIPREGYLEAEAASLERISARPGVLTVDFEHLANQETCQQVFEHCLQMPFDYDWWKQFSVQRLVIDPVERSALVAQRSDALTALFRQIDGYVTVGIESLDSAYRDSAVAREEHRLEAGPFDGLPFDPDLDQFRVFEQMKQLVVVTARTPADGVIGYLVVLLVPSLESKGIWVGHQNVFFVRKQHRGKFGLFMHRFAREYLASRGVHGLILRSGVRASGPRLGQYYQRIGARSLGQMFYLPLGK